MAVDTRPLSVQLKDPTPKSDHICLEIEVRRLRDRVQLLENMIPELYERLDVLETRVKRAEDS
jgi:hypothetical protein